MAGRYRNLFIGRVGLYENEADVRQAEAPLHRDGFRMAHIEL